MSVYAFLKIDNLTWEVGSLRWTIDNSYLENFAKKVMIAVEKEYGVKTSIRINKFYSCVVVIFDHEADEAEFMMKAS